MRVAQVVCSIVLLVISNGCAPVYVFSVDTRTLPESQREKMVARLLVVLHAHGYRWLGAARRALGPIGCGQDAADRETFEKDVGLAGWVWAHQFTCETVWHTVIVCSEGAVGEAQYLRDEIAEEFEYELAIGLLKLNTKYRVVLE